MSDDATERRMLTTSAIALVNALTLTSLCLVPSMVTLVAVTASTPSDPGNATPRMVRAFGPDDSTRRRLEA